MNLCYSTTVGFLWTADCDAIHSQTVGDISDGFTTLQIFLLSAAVFLRRRTCPVFTCFVFYKFVHNALLNRSICSAIIPSDCYSSLSKRCLFFYPSQFSRSLCLSPIEPLNAFSTEEKPEKQKDWIATILLCTTNKKKNAKKETSDNHHWHNLTNLTNN